MADQLIRAGIVLTGDAAGAVAAFAATKREAETLKQKFNEAQAEVARLAREVKAFGALGVQPTAVLASFDQAKETAGALKAELDAAQLSLEGTRRSMAQFGITSTSLNADLGRLKGRIAETGKEAEGSGKKFDVLGAGLGFARQLASLAGIGLGLGTAKVVIETADAYQLVQQRLSLVTSSSVELAAVQRELFASAQRTRNAFIESADSYARMARATDGLGFSQERLLRINEAVNKALTISGGSRESQQAALIQFSQALGSNRFSGDEFRSVSEQAPRLLKAISEGLGVTTAELRKMGEQGQLTTEKVLGGLEKGIPKLEAEFAKLAPAAGQAFTNLKNSAGNAVDKINEGTGSTRLLADTLKTLSSATDSFSSSAETFFNRLDLLIKPAQIAIDAKAAAAASALGLDSAAERNLRNRAENMEALSKAIVKAALSTGDLAQNERELARQYAAATPPTKASAEFLDIQSRLTGVNKDFTRELNVLFGAYEAGVIPVEKYRALVAKLIETETEAGKSAKAAADARIKANRDLVEKSVQDQKNLADAVRKAFEESLADAKKFATEAEKLRVDASTVRQSTAAKAEARRSAGSDLTPEEQSARAARSAQDLLDKSSLAASGALAAAYDGRFEVAKRKAEQAKSLAEEAEKLADKVTSDRRAAEIIEDAGRAQAAALEALAKGQDKAAAGARTQADAQREILASLEERAKALKDLLDKLPVSLDTEPARAAFKALQEEFGKGFTVPLRTSAANETPALASGGPIDGPGPRGRDSVLLWGAPGEFVHRTAAVDYYGIDFMRRLNAMQIPRFAAGGLIERVRVREPASGGGSATVINLTLPGVGTYPVSAEAGVAGELVRGLQRAALQRGRR